MTNPATTATDDTAADAAPVDDKRWLGLAVIAIAQLMVVLDASIVNIALPSAQRDLGITDANRQWVVTAYTLAFPADFCCSAAVSLTTWVARRHSSLVLLGLRAPHWGIAQNQEMLFAARGLQGAFAALLRHLRWRSLLSPSSNRTNERRRSASTAPSLVVGPRSG